MLVEVLRALRHAEALEVAGRGADVPAHVEEMALHQLGLSGRVHADGDVGLAHGEVELEIVEQEGHRDVGVEIEEAMEAGGEPVRAETGRGGDLEAAGRLLLALGEQRLGHRELGEDLADGAVERLALLGEDEAARMPMEERHLQASSSAEIWRDTADWLRLSVSPACVKLPASATAWKTRSLSQSIVSAIPVHPIFCGFFPRAIPPPGTYSGTYARAHCAASAGLSWRAARNFSASSAAMQPLPAAVTAWRKMRSCTSPAAKTPATEVRVEPGVVRM